MKSIFYLILITVLINSCSKSKKDGVIKFDLNIINVDNTGPLTVELKLNYSTKRPYNGGWEQKEISLGELNNGNYKNEINIESDARGIVLSYYSFSQVVPLFDSQGKKYFKEVLDVVDINSINTFDINIKPLYKFRYGFNNTSCYNETDSLWLLDSSYNEYGEVIRIGCIDTLEYSFFPGTISDPILTMYYKVKRNGIILQSSSDFQLSTETTNCVLEY